MADEKSNQPQNLPTTVLLACPVFWDRRIAESSSKRPERLYQATNESKCTSPQLNIRCSSGSTEEDEEEKLKKTE